MHHGDAEYAEFGVFFDQKLFTARPPWFGRSTCAHGPEALERRAHHVLRPSTHSIILRVDP